MNEYRLLSAIIDTLEFHDYVRFIVKGRNSIKLNDTPGIPAIAKRHWGLHVEERTGEGLVLFALNTRAIRPACITIQSGHVLMSDKASRCIFVDGMTVQLFEAGTHDEYMARAGASTEYWSEQENSALRL